MNQSESLLLGSDESIENLAAKESATIAVVSDSHGDVKDLLTVFKNCDNCDALIFCGDGISDLTMILDGMKNQLPPVIAFVKGNNDISSFALKNSSGGLSNVKVPVDQILKVAGHNIFISHGHCYGVNAGVTALSQIANENCCDVAVFGHTHVASHAKINGVLILNPGSIGLPRGGQPKCFAKMFLEKGRPANDYVFFQISKSLAGEVDCMKNPICCG